MATSETKRNPKAISPTDAARLLSSASGLSVTPEMIDADIAAGAPTDADGTVNLVHYAAWLIREMANGDA